MTILPDTIRKPIWPILLVLVFSLFLNIYGIWWGLPTSGNGWATDEVLPKHVLNGIERSFSDGWYSKYPPFHYYALAVLYTPFLLLQKLKWIDTTELTTYTILFYIGRFLSVLMGTATVFVVYLCGREIYERGAAVFAALITSMIVTFVYHAKIANLDVPYLFWFALSLLFYIRILKNQKMGDYLLFSVTAAISVCTKDQAYGLYILTAVFIVIHHFWSRLRANEDASMISAVSDRRIIFSLFLGLILFLLLQNVLFNWDGFLGHFKYITGPEPKVFQIYENNISGHLVMFYQLPKYLIFSFGWPIFIVCCLGLLGSFLTKKKNYLLFWILIPGVSYYVFFMGIVLFNPARFYLPICIILAFFGGKFLCDFLNPVKGFYRGRIVVVGAMLTYTFLYAFSVDILMDRDSRYYVERWVQQNIERNSSLVIVSAKAKLLPIRAEQFESHNIRSLLLREPESLAGISLEKLKLQLAEMEPEYIITTCRGSNCILRQTTDGRLILLRPGKRSIVYKPVLKYKSSAGLDLLSYDHIYTHLNKINPKIIVFKRI